MNFRFELTKILMDITGLDQENFILEIPPEGINSDFACPCFKLAKIFHKSPNLVAKEIAEKIFDYKSKLKFVSEAKAEGAYINFSLDRSFFARSVISDVINKKK